MAQQKLCTECEMLITPKRNTKGNIGIEIILWICFIIPGLIYSLWRQFNKYDACPYCGGDYLLPANSPKAQRILASYK